MTIDKKNIHITGPGEKFTIHDDKGHEYEFPLSPMRVFVEEGDTRGIVRLVAHWEVNAPEMPAPAEEERVDPF